MTIEISFENCSATSFHEIIPIVGDSLISIEFQIRIENLQIT